MLRYSTIDIKHVLQTYCAYDVVMVFKDNANYDDNNMSEINKFCCWSIELG